MGDFVIQEPIFDAAKVENIKMAITEKQLKILGKFFWDQCSILY